MNKHKKKRLIAIRLCSIVLFTSFVAASARAQTPRSAPAVDRSDTISGLSLVSRFGFLFPSSGFRSMRADSSRARIDNGVAKELDKAWCISGAGTNGREGVVLIFRMPDGSYTGKSQGFTNEQYRFTFKWNPAALAIVHTHPNHSDPRPAEQDRRVADKYGVPNFTITISGMYVYDPATKKTSKVLNGLDWLDLSSHPDELTRWLGSVDTSLHQISESGQQDEPCRLRGKQC